MAPPSSPLPTLYFGYGSNLWLHQMHLRCPASPYLGLARLRNYSWLINERGFANVVAGPRSDIQRRDAGSDPTPAVYGLLYQLSATDEAHLDVNEGVPVAYTKEELDCDFWRDTTITTTSTAADTTKKLNTDAPPDKTLKMLVYIDRKQTTPAEPRGEYIYRMNRGIADALRLGVPETYVTDVLRKFIPAEEGGGGGGEEGGNEEEEAGDERKNIEELARGQAARFKDESGVVQ